jgi:hypothetical protein
MMAYGALKELPGIGAGGRPIEIDVRNDRSADEQRLLVRIVALKLNPDRQPLDDLDVVARGILRRQQCERRSGPHGEAREPAFEHLSVAVHVDIEIGSLTDAQVAQLRLLEIGIDPDLTERTDRHQALPDLNVIAGIDVSARDDAVDLRDDVTIAKVEFSQSEVALGGFQFSLGLLDRWRFRRQPIERAVDVAFVELFELFEHPLRGLVVGMDNAQLGRGLNQVRLRLQDRRKRLIKIGRYLVEIRAVFGLRLQAQRDTDLVRIRQGLDDIRPGNRQRCLTLIIEFAGRKLRYDQLRRPLEFLLRECN